jgi:hypothetical protein
VGEVPDKRAVIAAAGAPSQQRAAQPPAAPDGVPLDESVAGDTADNELAVPQEVGPESSNGLSKKLHKPNPPRAESA